MSYIGNVPTQSAFVTDLFNGDNSTTAFTMSVSPANPASILVAVSGVLQSPDTYSISGRTLNFSAAPPSATGNISVRYLGIPASGVTTTAYRTLTEYTATAGQTTFTPPSYTVGFINVFRNGVMLGTADYTASNGTSVVLTNACSSGDLVVVESFYVSSVLNAIPATANAVNNLYISDGAITQSKLATGVVGNGPAFYAQASGSITIGNSAITKVTFNSEIFDTASCYDPTTNYRFTPNVAGYYQINALVQLYSAPSTSGVMYSLLYKNGSAYVAGPVIPLVNGNESGSAISSLVYLNGTTDYVEVYARQNSSGNLTLDTGIWAQFSGFLARAA